MSQNTIILLLGSNLGDRNLNLEYAKEQIELKIGKIIENSTIIETEPEDFVSENRFLNQTLKLSTIYSPIQLLKEIKSIESKIGRKYKNDNTRYQDRKIDIDILQFNGLVFKSAKLTLPHHQIYTRAFMKLILIC